MSVIGFDIGNESCVIAVAKRGGVDVLLNDDSKRQTPAVVSFGGKQRFFGSTGDANPKSTISQIKRLIGKLYKEVEGELKLLPFVTIEGPRDGILIELDYLKKKWTFTPVEILGMLFKHLKRLTEKSLDSSVVDCVIGIPSYFSDLQRRLYLDAAHLAGLKPLRLMHDGTAIALGYGMYLTDFSNSGTTNVVFVDIGHCDTQVTVAAFEQGRMQILAHSFDQNLGGRDFDEVLFKHFVEQFNQKHKIDICSNLRASVRLRASCEKVKKVLSVNTEAPLSIDCLIGDTDVTGFITRNEFENLSSSLLKRVTDSCRRALKDSGLTLDKIHTIELVGSGSRIPAITKSLTSCFKKEPTRTLNASECVARGCALRCAMLSPTLIVHPYKIKDSFPYSIVIPVPPPQRENMVFQKGHPFPNQETLMHARQIPFYMQVAYKKDNNFPRGISHVVGHFGIGSSETSEAKEGKVKFTIRLNPHGIVEMHSATMAEDNHSSGSRKSWGRISMNTSHELKLPVTKNVDESTTNDELNEAKENEKILEQQDMKVEEIKDQKNTLESFVYDTRNKLSSTYKSFATDSEKDGIRNELKKTEEWLYEDSDDESEQDYTARLEHLKMLIEPVETRYKEQNDIVKARTTLQACIAKYQSHAESLPVGNKKEKVKKECDEAEQWLNGLSQKQLPPRLLLKGINSFIERFESTCESIMRSEPSSQRCYEEPPDYENSIAKAQRDLQACIANYRSSAESLPAGKKEKVKKECINVEQWLASLLLQLHYLPNDLLHHINHAIPTFQRNCKIIIESEPSAQGHEEPMDYENAIAKAKIAMQTRIADYRLSAESLPARKKEKVKKECSRAEQWLDGISQQHHLPKALLDSINHTILGFASFCKSIIESDPVNSENAIGKAQIDPQTCISKGHPLAESLPAGSTKEMEEQVLDGLSQLHVSPPNALITKVNRTTQDVGRNYKSTIESEASARGHEEPVVLHQIDQTTDMDHNNKDMDVD